MLVGCGLGGGGSVVGGVVRVAGAGGELEGYAAGGWVDAGRWYWVSVGLGMASMTGVRR